MLAKDHQPLPHPDSVGRKITKDHAIMLLREAQTSHRAIRLERDAAKQETAFVRTAYDQLVSRQDQEKQRFIGRLMIAIEGQVNAGYSESTVAHFCNILRELGEAE